MTQKRTVYNNGQTGHTDFPDVSVVRDTAKIHPETGAIAAINTPQYGHIAARSRYNSWVEKDSTAASWHVPIAGYLGDGVTRMAMARAAGAQTWQFWVGTDIDGRVVDGGSAVQQMDADRLAAQTINGAAAGLDDIMENPLSGDTPHPDQATVALRCRSAVALPGCFLLVCEKIVLQSGIIWDTEGISLVRIQYDPGTGLFARHWIADLGDHTSASDPFVAGWQRLREWATPTYFPFTQGQNPCLRCFIPIVDYINDSGQTPQLKGGQLAIIEATRENISDPWAFGGFQFIYEKLEDGVHFHTAAWTPRGVVLAQGDGADQNENVLATCSDWDDYTNDSNWTIINKAYGSGAYGGVYPQQGLANQWAGACPSKDDINSFMCGSDVTPKALWKCTVNADLTISYIPLWGYMAGHDLNSYFALDLTGPSKEIQNGVAITPQNLASFDTAPLRVPVVYGHDDENFTAIGRMPTTHVTSSLCKIHGTDVYLFNLGGTSSIWKLPLPTVTRHQGLSIAPGGVKNVLELDGTEYTSLTFRSITVGSYVTDASAPGTNPVVDVESTGDDSAAQQIIIFSTTDGTIALPADTTACWFIMWVRNMTAVNGIGLRIIHFDTGGTTSAYGTKQYYTGITEGDWQLVVFTIENGLTPWSNPNDGKWRMEVDASVDMPFHFRFQIQGIYRGPQCPYLVANEATGANEQVFQTLPILDDDNWSVGIEFHVPACGEEYNYAEHPTPIVTTVTLATVYVDSDNFVEIELDYTDDTINFITTVGGVLQAGVTPIINVAIARDCTIQVGITWNGTFLQYYIACGGLDNRGLATNVKVNDIGTPVAVRIGNADFTQVPNIELNQIVVNDDTTVDGAGFLDMMADVTVPSSGSGGYVVMSHFNLVTPKII